MFLSNKYSKTYFKIIHNAQQQDRSKKENYFERHHIIPRSLGGLNSKDNLVNLTPREHFLCHWLLTKMVLGNALIKMQWAFHRIAFTTPSRAPIDMIRLTSAQYEIARRNHSNFLKQNHPSKIDPNWGQRLSLIVKSHWDANPQRKIITSQRMKQQWIEKPLITRELSIKNLPPPMRGKENARSIEIEYNGSIYFGWREFKEATSISKHLYNKYYMNGIDPTSRIGKDGPIIGRKHYPETIAKMKLNHRSRKLK